nr:MAG TPA: hypothetical protein [Caudoviricetes sp.]
MIKSFKIPERRFTNLGLPSKQTVSFAHLKALVATL